jgi:hypothetical protein
MYRVLLGVVFLGVLWGAPSGLPVAQANPMIAGANGTPVNLPGAENAAATADHFLRDIVIRLLGGVTMVGGLASLSRNVGAGLTVAGGGLGMIFVPNVISSGADTAAAATSLAVVIQTPLAVWMQWGGTVFAEAMVFLGTLVGVRTWRRHARAGQRSRHLET